VISLVAIAALHPCDAVRRAILDEARRDFDAARRMTAFACDARPDEGSAVHPARIDDYKRSSKLVHRRGITAPTPDANSWSHGADR